MVPGAGAGALTTVFLAVDLAFLGANALKIREGGWVPLAIAGSVYLLMSTWKRGTILLRTILNEGAVPLESFLKELERRPPVRIPGTAVFLTARPDGTPLVLRHHLTHNKALHEEVVILSILNEEVPEVPGTERITTEKLAHGFFRVRASFGFMETPDVPEIVRHCRDAGLRADPEETSYYLGRARVLPEGGAPMQKWRKLLFGFLVRNAHAATEYFRIPPERVVELGARVEF